MKNFQLPAWFSLKAESKDDAIAKVQAVIKTKGSDIDFSVESENVLEFDENGDEVESEE